MLVVSPFLILVIQFFLRQFDDSVIFLRVIFEPAILQPVHKNKVKVSLLNLSFHVHQWADYSDHFQVI